MEHAPLPAIIDDKLEDTMSVRYPELSGVCARRARDGHQPSANMRVEHRKIELHILNTGVGNPASGRWVKPCYIEGIDLFHENNKGEGERWCSSILFILREQVKCDSLVRTTTSLVVYVSRACVSPTR